MVISLVLTQIIIPNLQIKNTYKVLEKFEGKGFVTRLVKGKNYDYLLENEEITLLIKVVPIPSNSSVTINSKNTWRLSWGGNPNNKGRAYPRDRYLNELVPFLKETIKKDKKTLKLILLYKRTEKILMYLNESELDLVDAKKTPYGYKVTTLNRIEEEFEDIVNIK
jgi:hypothetical protein